MRFLAVACGVALMCLLGFARSAHAEAPGPRATPVHVLGIDSDDAEDQADALTGALRSRVRSAPGWSLQETQHSLGMLTAALRCPAKPDAPCLQRIGDQLHTDRFVWGVMSKAPGNQVSAEVHLWARGRPDSVAKETYSDNLQDQNDETLRRIAARILDKISGAAQKGTLTIHAGDSEGMVWINGQKTRALDHGAATIELAPGRYSVEVRAQGFATASQDGVLVSAGQETSLPLKMATVAVPTSTPESSASSVDVRRLFGWGLLGLGVVGEIVAGVEAIQFLSAKGDLNTARSQVPASITDVCGNTAAAQFNAQAVAACSKYNQASSDRTVAAVVGSIGLVALAAGTILLLTEAPRESGGTGAAATTARTERPAVSVQPYAAARGVGGGVDLAITF
jgi:hypothetical protein